MHSINPVPYYDVTCDYFERYQHSFEYEEVYPAAGPKDSSTYRPAKRMKGDGMGR